MDHTNLLDDIINFKYKIYAHTAPDKAPETLQEHIKRCEFYQSRLVEGKKLGNIIERFLREYLNECSEQSIELAREVFTGIIIFHDTGKINPAFQKDKMQQKNFSLKNLPCLTGACHSFLSSVIYLDYYYGIINKSTLKKEEKKRLRALVYAGAYLISRHHSNLEDMGNYKEEFCENGQAFIIVQYLSENKFQLYKGPFYFNVDNIQLVQRADEVIHKCSRTLQIYYFMILRLLYSILASSDYYATAEYIHNCEIKNCGYIANNNQFLKVYESNKLVKSIRQYEAKFYGKQDISMIQDMNSLRNEMFLDAEKYWEKNKSESLFYLEAPTGSGKSNTAMNLSFRMQEAGQDKIFYVYPFNTLVEQNLKTLKKLLGQDQEVVSKVTVINSITPIKADQKELEMEQEYDSFFYQNALLDRQFLNYPFILTTHVNLFDILFGNQRESLFGFFQLANSVIVLDEIQSYRNQIWSEIINFLKAAADLMNIKVIIMSATLPNLSYLTEEKNSAIHLISDRSKYFEHPVFSERVQLSYELIEEKIGIEELYQHICSHTSPDKGVLVEFIKKSTAYEFFELLCSEHSEYLKERQIFLLTGDDNVLERTRILKEIEKKREGAVLVATQVIEAGVDIDMDIGYKDISKLDSEEQFLGRINRSYKSKRNGKVYFFDMDSAEKIYKNDIRKNVEFTLKKSSMQSILKSKCFEEYYRMILNVLKKQFNESSGEEGLEYFFQQVVANGRFRKVAERMKLIEENDWTISVYLSRTIVLDDGTTIDGWECWNEYKELLRNEKMDYARKQIYLSNLRQKMSYFIYEIKKNSDLIYSERIGELRAIQNGEVYFVNGKLNKKKLEQEGGMFLEW